MNDLKSHGRQPYGELRQQCVRAHIDEMRYIEELGMLAAGAAHDVRNLMTTVLCSASRLRAKYPPGHPDHESLWLIEQAAESAGRLSHQLLIYARGGKARLRSVDFATMVANAVRVFVPAMPANVQLETRIPGNLGQVECDSTLIQQVVINLCRNAVEAMAEGGLLTIEAAAVRLNESNPNTLPRLPAGEYLCVTVTDTGSGMDADTVGRVFDPFFTTKPDGHGLGLSIAFSTMKRHGGAISLTTRPQLGSAFVLWLPRR